MNEHLKKRIILSIATLSALSTLATVPTIAFGEYDKSDGTSVLYQNMKDEDYQNWYDTEWNNQEKGEMDTGKVVLTPGKNERDLNFAWYSETKGTPQIKISKNQDMSGAKLSIGTASNISKSNKFKNYVASNKVAINDYLEENTKYYYQYSIDGTDWSEVYEYQTHSFSNYQAILVGDPQIGATGGNGEGTLDDQDIAINTYSWNKTLQKALGQNGIAQNASFILSAGDQIDYSSSGENGAGEVIREQEYAGFLYPSVLRNIPLATTIGNHESKVDDYSLHYNNPNASELGKTESGGDYYYSYGDSLFISLNSNSRNVEEHRTLMNEAVASHPDAKWKVVLFHHDIYGSGSPHSDVDGANLRILFAPLMDEFNIDLCLTGHDHSYARTYQIVDGKIVDTQGVSSQASSAYNPEGTLYIAAGSATGSKFYTLNTTKQYYIAERSNTPIPTFSTIDFTTDSLTIKTYDFEGNKYANDVTLKKDGEAKSIEEMKTDLSAIDTLSLTSGSKDRIDKALNDVNKLLDSRDDSEAIKDLTTKWNTTSDPLNYYGYAQNGYANTTSTALKQGYSQLLDKTLYENGTNTSVSQTEIDDAYSKMLYAKEEMVTKTEFATVQVKFDEINKLLTEVVIGNKKGEYQLTDVNEFKKIVASLKPTLNETTITKTELNSLSEQLSTEIEKFKAKANDKDIVNITPTTPENSANTVNSNNAVKTGDDVLLNIPVIGIIGSLVVFLANKFYKSKEI